MLLAGSTRYFVFNVPSLRHSSDNLSASSHTQECVGNPLHSARASLPKAPNRDKHHGRDFALPLSARPCNTPHSSHCQSSLVRRLEQKPKHSLSLDRVFGFSKTCLSVTEPEIRIRSTGLFFGFFFPRHIMSIYREKT